MFYRWRWIEEKEGRSWKRRKEDGEREKVKERVREDGNCESMEGRSRKRRKGPLKRYQKKLEKMVCSSPVTTPRFLSIRIVVVVVVVVFGNLRDPFSKLCPSLIGFSLSASIGGGKYILCVLRLLYSQVQKTYTTFEWNNLLDFGLRFYTHTIN